MWSALIGNVNVYNVLAASAAGYARDCSAEAIAKGLLISRAFPAALSAWNAASRSP